MSENHSNATSPAEKDDCFSPEAALEHESAKPSSDALDLLSRDDLPLTRQEAFHLLAKTARPGTLETLREQVFDPYSSLDDSHILRFDFNEIISVEYSNSSMALILRWLRSCDNLAYLVLPRESKLEDQHAKLLARCFAKHTSLRVLRLVGGAWQIGIPGQGMKEILTLHQLTTLDISYNTLDEVGAKALAHFIRANEALQDLDISGCFVLAGTEELTTPLNALFQENPKSGLQRLKMVFNKIEGEDAVKIMKAMVSYPHIRWLDLSYNRIGDEHMQLMAKDIASSDTLEVLRLCDNAIETEGAVALGTEIRNKGALRQLFLDENKISEDGLIALLDSRGLRDLSMSTEDTPMSMSDSNLAAALSRTNVWKLRFSVGSVRAEFEGIDGILALMERHRFAEISLLNAVVPDPPEFIPYMIAELNERDSMAQLRVIATGGSDLDDDDGQLFVHNDRFSKMKDLIKKRFVATAAVTAEKPSQENLRKYCLTFEPGELEQLPQAVVPNILQLFGPSPSHEYKYGIYTHLLYAVLRKKAMGTSDSPWSNIRRKLLSKRKFESVTDNDLKLPGKQKR